MTGGPDPLEEVAAVDSPRIVLPRRQLVVVTVGLMLSQLLAALDTSIVATAMPRIVEDLSGLEFYAWVTTAYLVSSTTIIPISGKLGDLFGRKRFLQGGMIGFLVSSALCGLSQSMPELVVARAVQGVFGGFLTSSTVASIADLYLPATRARMQGVFVSVFAFAAIAGPIVGGVLTDQFGWRSVFYVNIPLGIVAAATVALTMPHARTEATLRHIDVRGALFLAAGLVPLLTALTAMREDGLGSPLVVALLVAAVLMLAAFLREETRADHPVMPLELFRTPTFTVAVIVSFLAAFGMFGSNIFVPLLYQGVLGLTATQSGLFLTPRMGAMVVASLISGQIVSRIDRYRFVSAFGLGMLALGLFLLSRVTAASSEGEVMRDLLVIGTGFGLNQPIYQNAVMSAVPHRFVGVASSQVQFWNSLGQTIGVTVLGALLAVQIGQNVSPDVLPSTADPAALTALTNGLELAFVASAIAAAAAVGIALLLKEVPMRGRRRAVEAVAAVAEAAAVAD
ncbi:MAG: MFS transporter [Chloroflexota bacterium]|nr:MFS transporter [Chloroflexota bacterium]